MYKVKIPVALISRRLNSKNYYAVEEIQQYLHDIYNGIKVDQNTKKVLWRETQYIGRYKDDTAYFATGFRKFGPIQIFYIADESVYMTLLLKFSDDLTVEFS